MCYRNGTGHRCECCGKEKKEISIITYGVDGSNRKERICPVLMIAVIPGEPMKIITELDAEEYLPSFEDTDDISEAPGLDLVMSYDKNRIIQIDDRYYLDGPCLIYELDEDGEIISVSGEMMYSVQEWIEKRTVLICHGEAEIEVLDLN